MQKNKQLSELRWPHISPFSKPFGQSHHVHLLRMSLQPPVGLTNSEFTVYLTKAHISNRSSFICGESCQVRTITPTRS